MRRPLWERLELSEEEWLDCVLSSRETTQATGERVSPRQVAIEYATARGRDPLQDTAAFLLRVE